MWQIIQTIRRSNRQMRQILQIMRRSNRQIRQPHLRKTSQAIRQPSPQKLQRKINPQVCPLVQSLESLLVPPWVRSSWAHWLDSASTRRWSTFKPRVVRRLWAHLRVAFKKFPRTKSLMNKVSPARSRLTRKTFLSIKLSQTPFQRRMLIFKASAMLPHELLSILLWYY